MNITTKARHGAVVRIVWLVLGAFFALLTTRVLLWEVHSISELTADHYLTVGAIVGAITAGVFAGPMLRAGKLLSALGLALAFAAATAYCLIGSAGRGDEAAFEKNSAARQVNEDRARTMRDRDEAKQRYETAMVAETQECSGGAGGKCIAKRQITAQRRSDFEVQDLLVRQLKSEQRENGKLKRAAELVSFFGRIELTTAEKGLSLMWPFIPPFICEMLTITFLHLAFAVPAPRRRRDRPAGATVADSPTPGPGTVQPSHGTVPQTVAETVGVVLPFRRPAKPTTTAESDVLAYVTERLEAGETLPSQAAIVRRFHVPKQTVSRWMAGWEAERLISRTRDGRRNVIRSTNWVGRLRAIAGRPAPARPGRLLPNPNLSSSADCQMRHALARGTKICLHTWEGAMRILSALIPLAAFGGIAPAGALPSQLHNPQSLQQAPSGVERVARRVVAPHLHYRSQNRGHVRQPRQFVTPPTTAAPMARVPQVAPLAPRIGN